MRPPPRRLFPPPGQAVVLRNKGEHTIRVLTAGGEVQLKRRYFWSKQTGGVYLVDEAAGLAEGDVSAGAKEICCRMAIMEDFADAAEDIRRIGGLPVSKEWLRQRVEAEAQAVSEARHGGVVLPSWSVQDAAIREGGPTRMYTGIDGVMVPTVTQEEKDQRRQKQITRRQQRIRCNLGNAKQLPPARPGSDEAFKEMKIGVFYDQDKAHRHVFATAENHEGFGPLLKAHARQIGFEQADEQISLTDGAKWIMGQLCQFLLTLHAMLLDFYHLSEHVYGAAKCCLGDTPAARWWAQQRLEEIKELGARPVLAAIDALSKKVRAAAKRKALRSLRDYIVQRLEMVEYREAVARGWDIGSGPTEAMCKNLTLRLKRPGMKWDRDHAADLMNLIAL